MKQMKLIMMIQWEVKLFDKNMIYGNNNDNNNDNDNNNKELNMIFRNEKIFNGNGKKIKRRI